MSERESSNKQIEGEFRDIKFSIEKTKSGGWVITTKDPVEGSDFIFLNYFTNYDHDEGVIIGAIYPGQKRAVLLGIRGGIQFHTDEELKKIKDGNISGFNGPRFEYG